jgi:hypothetical protein
MAKRGRNLIIAGDPGRAKNKPGGLALIDADNGEVVDCIKIPVFSVETSTKRRNKKKKLVGKGKGSKSVINYVAIRQWILSHVDLAVDKVRAVVEHLNPMPKFGAVANWGMSSSMYLLVGLFSGLGFRVRYIRPTKWQAIIFGRGHKADKDVSRGKAAELAPKFTNSFKSKNQDGIAEAVLIGIARYRQLKRLNMACA